MRIFILFLLLMPALAFAKGKAATASAKPVFVKAEPEVIDEDKLAEAISPFVKSIEKPIMTFHWEKADSDLAKEFNADTSEGAVSLAKKSSESFLATNAAKGFYLATDPRMSRSYGRENWRLLQIEFPKGLKYLDISDTMPFIQSVYGKMPGACTLRFIVAKTIPFEEGKCADLKRKMFERLGISAIRYRWGTPRVSGQCSGTDESAFVLTSGDFLNSGTVKAFTADTKDYADNRKYIQEIVPISSNNKTGKFEQEQLWADIPKRTQASPETKRWMQKYLLNCRADASKGEEPEEVQKGDSAE
ncbi:MAG: hypothetical protein ACXWQO_19135 [Bdellovibrionota bacterium]